MTEVVCMELELAATLLLVCCIAEEWLMVQKLYTCMACQVTRFIGL